MPVMPVIIVNSFLQTRELRVREAKERLSNR